MADTEFQKIHQARLEQLQAASGLSQLSPEARQEQERARRQAEDQEKILIQILEPDALERLGRLAVVRSTQVEDVKSRLVHMFRTDQLKQRMTDEELKVQLGFLAKHEDEEKGVKITFMNLGRYDDAYDEIDAMMAKAMANDVAD